MLIDLRSDTVTRPTPLMLEAMFNAKTGDDVFEEDETVNLLQQKAAGLFNMEDALFCPSGTMTNQIAIKILTQPADEVLCDKLSHVYNYEGGGIAFHSGASVRLIEGNKGLFTAKDVEQNINPDNIHYPNTSLVCLENTSNRGGGCIWDDTEIEAISNVCKRNDLYLHLDGARIFNAIIETGANPHFYGKHFNTISICLSKGLGAPVGSLLISSKEKIKKAKRIRKLMGGGMRQAGFLAAAGIYALDNNIERLKEDHRRAKVLAEAVRKLPYVDELFPVTTNIVVFRLDQNHNSNDFIARLAKENIKTVPFGPQTVRMVTHLDVTDDMIDKTCNVLSRLN